MGSPLYMPPEQMRGAKGTDSRSDIWALGVILYELVSAGAPFEAETFPELVLKIASEPPVPIRYRFPDVSPALEAVILRCLEKEPARRYASIAELAQALAEFAPIHARVSVERILGVLDAARPPGLHAGSSQRISGLSSDGATRAQAGTAASWGQTAPAAQRGRRAALLALAGISLIGVAAGVAFVVRRSPAAPVTPTLEPAFSAPRPDARTTAAAPVPSAQGAATSTPSTATPVASSSAAAQPPPTVKPSAPRANVPRLLTPSKPAAGNVYDDRK